MKQNRNRKAYAFDDELEQFTLNLDDSVGKTTVHPRKIAKKNSADSMWYYVGFASDFGFTVAVPLAGGAFLGGAIDKTMGTYPNMTLVCIVLGLLVSAAGLIRTIKELIHKKN